MLELQTEKNAIQQSIESLCEYVENIPFGNSDFQNQQSNINQIGMQHRIVRNSSLRMMDRLRALNENYFILAEKEIEVEELKRKIKKLEDEKPENYDLDISRSKLKIQKQESEMPYIKKLIKDAIQEINSLKKVTQIPKLSREEFESSERIFFEKKYQDALAGKNEILLSLEAIEKESFLLLHANNNQDECTG